MLHFALSPCFQSYISVGNIHVYIYVFKYICKCYIFQTLSQNFALSPCFQSYISVGNINVYIYMCLNIYICVTFFRHYLKISHCRHVSSPIYQLVIIMLFNFSNEVQILWVYVTFFQT
jgi:hypothetical protein